MLAFVWGLGLGGWFLLDLGYLYLCLLYVPLSDFTHILLQLLPLHLNIHVKKLLIPKQPHQILMLLLIQLQPINSSQRFAQLPQPVTKINISQFINNLQSPNTLLDTVEGFPNAEFNIGSFYVDLGLKEEVLLGWGLGRF